MKTKFPASKVIVGLATFSFCLSQGLAKENDALMGATPQASPFQGVCENVLLISNEDYQKQKPYWDGVQLSCSSQVQTQVLPDAYFLNSMVSRLSQGDDKQAADFLKKIGKRTLENMDYNNKITEVIMRCTEEASREYWFAKKRAEAKAAAGENSDRAKREAELYDETKCDQRLSELRKVIQEKGKEFRVNLEMARRTSAFQNKAASATRAAVDAVVQVSVEAEKVPLKAEEKALADKMEAELDAKAEPETRRIAQEGARRMDEILAAHPEIQLKDFHDPSVPEWVVEWVKGSRSDTLMQQAIKNYKQSQFEKYFSEYSKALSSARILAFLGSADPTNGQIGRAALKLLENGQASRKEVEKTLAKGEKVGSDADRAKSMLALLQYGSVARDLLKEDSSDCRVASALTKYISDSDTRTKAYIGAGLIAGTLVAPLALPAAMTAAGMTVSAGLPLALATTAGAVNQAYMIGSIGEDYLNLQAAKRQSLNYAHDDSASFGAGRSVSELESFQEARNTFAFDAAVQAAFAATAAPGAYRSLTSQNASRFNSQEVMDLLKKQGLSESEAKGLLRDFGSQNADTAKKAATKLAGTLGVEAVELNTFQKIVAKDLLDPKASLKYDDYYSRLMSWKRESPEVRQELHRRAQQMIDLFPNSLSSNKKTDALRLALAASEAGVKDTKQVADLAAKVTGWETQGSLRGLARAFDKAAELRKMNPNLELSVAFTQGLEQLGIKDAAEINQMRNCALGVGTAR